MTQLVLPSNLADCFAFQTRKDGKVESILKADWLMPGGVQQAADPANQPLSAPISAISVDLEPGLGSGSLPWGSTRQ